MKRRKTPFHFTSRQFKVKTSRGIKLNVKKKHWYSSKRRAQQHLVTTLILNELSLNSQLECAGIGGDFNNVPFTKSSRSRRLRVNHFLHRQRMRRALRRFVAFVFLGRRATGYKHGGLSTKDENVVVMV